MKSKQLQFFKTPDLSYGGSHIKGRRKRLRPFDPKRPLHISMKSETARGNRSMAHDRVRLKIFALAHATAERAAVRLEAFENVGNHLHLLIRARKRADLAKFLRIFSGQVAMLMTGARKGRSGKFWTQLAWSRVVNWGRDLLGLHDYFSKNLLESIGVPRDYMISLRRFANAAQSLPP